MKRRVEDEDLKFSGERGDMDILGDGFCTML